MFVSVGVETANRYEQDEVKAMLDKLSDEEEYGTVLRAKGVLQNAAGDWFQFDYVPGESQFRPGTPDYTGRLCVIGAHIDEKHCGSCSRHERTGIYTSLPDYRLPRKRQTQLINSMLTDDNFSRGQKTLVICCEEGVEEYERRRTRPLSSSTKRTR